MTRNQYFVCQDSLGAQVLCARYEAKVSLGKEGLSSKYQGCRDARIKVAGASLWD